LNQKLVNFYNENFHYVDYSWDVTLAKDFTDTIIKLQENISKFQTSALQKIDTLRQEELANINSIITEEIKEFCILNEIETLVEKKSLIYFSDCEDFTAEILLFIKSTTQK